MQILIQQTKIIDPNATFNNKIVDILVEDGIIKDISTQITTREATIIAAPGLMVSPGWVDVFADYCEPGLEHKETITTGLATAAAGGFTHVFLVPNTMPALSNKSLIEFVFGKAKNNIVDLHPLGAATQNIEGKDLAEMIDMQQSGAIAFTDGWKPIQNAGLTLKTLEYLKAFSGILLQIPNDVSLSAGGLMHEGIVSTQLGMSGMPALAETLLLQRDIELLRYTSSRLHITGISTAESVALIQTAKAEGLDITCSVTPYHLALTDEVLKTYDSLYKTTPPLRTEADRLALINGLKTGVIDCIATHHHPQDWDAKAKEFEYAAGGMAIQQNAFSIIWDSVKDYLPIERIVEALTAPYTIFGIQQPAINIGNRATISIFTTQSNTTLQQAISLSKCSNNPFIGQELSGKVIGVINNNQFYINQ